MVKSELSTSEVEVLVTASSVAVPGVAASVPAVSGAVVATNKGKLKSFKLTSNLASSKSSNQK